MHTTSTIFTNNHKEFKFPLKVLLNIIFLSLVMIGAVAYCFKIGYEMSVKASLFVDATMKIKLEATTAHLWFEELISQDRSVKIEEVLKHIDNAIWYANAMIEGGENPEGTFVPLVNPIMRINIQEVLRKLNTFRDITTERYEAFETSGVGTPIDQRYDAIFISLQEQADFVKTNLQKIIVSDLKRYRYLQLLLILSLVLLPVILFVILYRYERHLTENIALIHEQYAQVKSLRGLVPMCALCKQVRDDESYWNKLEYYFETYSGEEIRQAICLECSKKFNP